VSRVDSFRHTTKNNIERKILEGGCGVGGWGGGVGEATTDKETKYRYICINI